jgi:hypothetical protein
VKIVLPFLYASRVEGNGFLNVVVDSSLTATSGYVVYGSNMIADINIAVKNNTRVLEIPGSVWTDFSGRSVSNAGDVNGDGYDDLIIGVPYASRCYVLYGTHRGFDNMHEGFVIYGAELSDLTGWAVSGGGKNCLQMVSLNQI